MDPGYYGKQQHRYFLWFFVCVCGGGLGELSYNLYTI